MLASWPHQAALTAGQFKPTPATTAGPSRSRLEVHAAASTLPGGSCSGVEEQVAEGHPLRRQLLQSASKAGGGVREGGFFSPKPRTALEAGGTATDPSPNAAAEQGQPASSAGAAAAAAGRGAVQDATAAEEAPPLPAPGVPTRGDDGSSMELDAPCLPDSAAELAGPCPAEPTKTLATGSEAQAVLPTPLLLPAALEPPPSAAACDAPGAGAADLAAPQSLQHKRLATLTAAVLGRPSDQSEGSTLHRLSVIGLDTTTPAQTPLADLLPLPSLPSSVQPQPAQGAGADAGQAAAAAAALPAPVQLITPAALPPQPLPVPQRTAAACARRPPRHQGKGEGGGVSAFAAAAEAAGEFGQCCLAGQGWESTSAQ